MDALSLAESVTIDCPPEVLYDMVADVTGMGEWSPVCKACWWEDGAPGQVGSTFRGRNETPERTWETVSTVVVAERAREFAWVVNGGWVRWGYRFEPAGGGTRVTESWEMLPAGIEGFRGRYGEEADAQVAQRRQAALSGMPVTLAALKAAAEATTAAR